jgi:hypothetical protein
MTIDAPPSAPKLDAPKEQKQPQDGSTKACNEVYDLLKSMRPGSGNTQPSELKDFGNLQIEDCSAAAKLDKDLLKAPEIKEDASEMKFSSHPRHERPATHAKAGEAEERRENEEKREGKEKSQQHHPGEHPDQNMFTQMVNGLEHASTEAQINIIKTATTAFLQEFQKADKQYSREADQHFWKGLQPCLNSVYTSVAMIDQTLHGEGGKVLPIYLQERTKQIDELKKELEQVMKKGVVNCGIETMTHIVKEIQQIFTEPGNKLADHAAAMVGPEAFSIASSGVKSEITEKLPDFIKDPYEGFNHAKEQITKGHEWDEKLGKLAHGERKEHHAGRSSARSHEASYTMSSEIASSDVHSMLQDFEVIDDKEDLKKHAA